MRFVLGTFLVCFLLRFICLPFFVGFISIIQFTQCISHACYVPLVLLICLSGLFCMCLVYLVCLLCMVYLFFAAVVFIFIFRTCVCIGSKIYKSKDVNKIFLLLLVQRSTIAEW